MPEVRIVTVEPLRAGKPSELIIKLINPTQHQTTITFLALDSEENEMEEKAQEQADNLEVGINDCQFQLFCYFLCLIN